MRLFQATLDTCLDSPFLASLSVHGLHFMVYAPSMEGLFTLWNLRFTWGGNKVYFRFQLSGSGGPIVFSRKALKLGAFSFPEYCFSSTFEDQKTTKNPGIEGSRSQKEIGHGSSTPSLIALKHSKTSVSGAFVPEKRRITEL